jgi:hypothetical protein
MPIADPEVWFVELDTIFKGKTEIDATYEQRKHEITLHIIGRHPDDNSNLITTIKGNNLTLNKLNARL